MVDIPEEIVDPVFALHLERLNAYTPKMLLINAVRFVNRALKSLSRDEVNILKKRYLQRLFEAHPEITPDDYNFEYFKGKSW